MKRILVFLALLCVTGSVFAQSTPPITRHNGGAMSGKMSGKKMPMRDPKGRFVKKTTKKMPMRDPKTGRFMKAPAKKMPMRDAKGRFMKSGSKM